MRERGSETQTSKKWRAAQDGDYDVEKRDLRDLSVPDWVRVSEVGWRVEPSACNRGVRLGFSGMTCRWEREQGKGSMCAACVRAYVCARWRG